MAQIPTYSTLGTIPPIGTGNPQADQMNSLMHQLATIATNCDANFTDLYINGVGTSGGNTVLYGAGAPSSGTGAQGNFYIDTVANNLYGPKGSSTWPTGTSLIGPAGSNGSNGTNGNTINHGTGAPGSGVGNNGDFYIDTAGNMLYGAKSAGAWGSGTSLVGPAGSGGSSSPMVASGASHAAGAAPDPGATAGTYRFLREDAQWASPDQINGAVGTIRNIATRCRHDNAYYGTVTGGTNIVQAAGRTFHVNMGPTVYGPQIVLGNWIANNTGEITPTGGAMIEQCSIEYPAGQFTMVTWDTANSSSVRTDSINIPAGGADVVSDPVPVRIPAGASFWIRRVSTLASGTAASFPFAFYSPGPNNPSTDTPFVGYTALGTNTSAANVYLIGGTLPTTNNYISNVAQLRFPLAILGLSNVASVMCLGDSRCAGTNDANLTTLAQNPPGVTNGSAVGEADWGRWGQGEVVRSIGHARPYINMGCPTDEAHIFVQSGNNTFRPRQQAYHTDVVVQYGVNDLNAAARTASAIETDLQTIYAMFPTKRVWQCTILPVATSTDSFATTANQTPAACSSQRTLLNNWIRTTPSPLVGYFDNSSVIETSQNSCIWNVITFNGVALGTPCDSAGIHPSPAYYKYIDTQKTIDPTRFTSI
jgi:hypothetical protein